VVSLAATDAAERVRGANMAEYVDGNEKAPLQSSAAGKRPPQKPDWTRFGLSGGDGQPPSRKPGSGVGDGDGGTLTRKDEDAGEVNEIYAEHEVSLLDTVHFHLTLHANCLC